MKHNRKLAALAITASLAVAGMAAPAGAHGDHDGPASGTSRLTHRQEVVVRTATRRFHRVDAALLAGYVPVSACTELPGVGGMGYHFLHPLLAGDDVVDPARPELLVYQEDGGRLRLGAVEYFVADADQDLTTDDDRPELFGRHPFDGPMEGHEADMPIHYDLHVWLYRHNPAGQLAAWNPGVRC
jgi:hypothetical protein